MSSIKPTLEFTYDNYNDMKFEELIKKFGVNSKYQYDGDSLLTFIVRFDSPNVENILKHNPNLYHTNNFKKTALELAIKYNKLNSVELLLSKIDIDHYNKRKINIVDQAIGNIYEIEFYNFSLRDTRYQKNESASYEILSLLLKAGATADIKDENGHTPIQQLNDDFDEPLYGNLNYVCHQRIYMIFTRYHAK